MTASNLKGLSVRGREALLRVGETEEIIMT